MTTPPLQLLRVSPRLRLAPLRKALPSTRESSPSRRVCATLPLTSLSSSRREWASTANVIKRMAERVDVESFPHPTATGGSAAQRDQTKYTETRDASRTHQSARPQQTRRQP